MAPDTQPQHNPEAGEIALLVKLSLSEERRVTVPEGACLLRVIEIIASERGLEAEELILVREGEAEALEVEVLANRLARRNLNMRAEMIGWAAAS